MINKKRCLFRIVIPAFPSFNIYSGIAKRTTALGPILVATSANKLEKWDVEVIDENNCKGKFCPKDELGRPDHKKLQEERPADVVGFYGSLTSTIPRLYELAGLYKKLGAKTIAGGKHIENLPKEALRNNIDAVVFGDGEEAIKELLLAWQKGKDLSKIAGVAYLDLQKNVIKNKERKLLADFEKMPLPDFNLLRYAKIKIYPISWWRGCPHNCEFCAVKDKTRCAPAQRLASIVAHLVETRKAKSFFIVDDHFGGNHYDEKQLKETLGFCRLISSYQKKYRKKLSFTVQIRLTAAKRPELLQAMREAGINTVCIGYESPIDEELIAMRKGFLSKHMVEMTKIFHKFGFFIHGMFIFGYPHKKNISREKTASMSIEEKTKRFKDFIRKAKIDTAQVLLTVPLPGTELRERLKQEGRIYPLAKIGWEYYDGQFPLFEPDDGASPEELQEAVKKIMGGFYKFNYILKIIANVTFHFPLIVFPASLTLVTLRVRYLTAAFRKWHRLYFRNQTLRFGGYLIVKNWIKKFNEGDFLSKLGRAKMQAKAVSLAD